jgi:outer membrane lipoprotein-sorting protein
LSRENRAGFNLQGVAAARTLIARAIERKGGLDRLRAVRSLAIESGMLIEGGSTLVKSKAFIAYPDKYRVDAETAGAEVSQVYASGDMWLITPTGIRTAPDFLREEAAAAVSRDLIGLLLRAWDGRATIAAAPAGQSGLSAIRVSQDGRDDVTLYFDPDTADVVRLAYERRGADGTAREVEDFSDFRLVDGIRFAFRATTTTAAGNKVERTVSAIRVNPTLAPSLFTRPGR